jgi:hypothetical protein
MFFLLKKNEGLNMSDPSGLMILFFASCGSFRIVDNTSIMAKDGNDTSV